MKRMANAALSAIAAVTLLMAASVSRSGAQTDNSIAKIDSDFLVSAITSGETEVTEGRANLNSNDAGVRMFATTIVHDHGLADARLGALAKQYEVEVPALTPPAAMGATSMDAAAYMRSEIANHKTAIALFQKESTGGSNLNVRAEAARDLPVLQAHLKMAQEYVDTGHVTPQPSPT